MGEPVTFISPLSRDQCVARLRAVIVPQWNLAPWRPHPAVGWITEDRLRIRKQNWYRNSFQPILKAKLEPEGTRTRLICQTSRSPMVVILLTIWFGAVVVATFGAVLRPLLGYLGGSIEKISLPLPAVIILPLVLVYGIALAAFGFYASRGERAFLLDFLRKTVDAPAVGLAAARDPGYRPSSR